MICVSPGGGVVGIAVQLRREIAAITPGNSLANLSSAMMGSSDSKKVRRAIGNLLFGLLLALLAEELPVATG